MARRARRTYDNHLREAQAMATRERILDAAEVLLGREGADALTLPKVARAARVSVPTAYRNFRTVQDLLAAFLERFRPRVGMTPERLLGTPARAVAALPSQNYPRFEANAALLRTLMDSPAFYRVRVASVQDRAARAAARFAAAAPRWRGRELQAALGTMYGLASPDAWRWLRDTWGLDAARARQAASWAVAVLARAIVRGTPSLTAGPRPRRGKKKKGASR